MVRKMMLCFPGAARRVLAVLLAAAMASAYCVPAQALAEALEAGSATDIAAEWSEGALTVSEAGSYTLSADVETDGALTVLAEEGETIEIDLAGHDVLVAGEAFCAIDVSGSLGTVVIRDSARDADEEDSEKATVAVSAEGAEGDVAGILATFTLPDGCEDGGDVPVPALEVSGVSVSAEIVSVDAEAAEVEHNASGICVGYEDADDPREELDVALDDVELSASVVVSELDDGALAELAEDGCAALDEENVGVAYGVYALAAGVSIDGSFSSKTEAEELDCALYSTAEEAFELCEGFELAEEIRVYAAGNEAGVEFASVDEGLDADEELLGMLVDGSGAGNVLEPDGDTLVFAEAPEADAQGVTLAAAIEAIVEEAEVAAAEGEAGDDGSGSELTISSVIEELVASSDAGETGLSTQAEEDTWTVTDSSGTVTGSYDSFDDAESVVANGGTIVLNDDLSATAATFDAKTSGSYTIDLNGHTLGELVYTCAADLTVTSSVDGGSIDCSVDSYGIYAKSSGDLSVEDIEVTCSDASAKSLYGVYLSTIANVDLEQVTIDLEIASGPCGLYSISVTSLTLDDCTISVQAMSTSASAASHGVYMISTTATVDGCSMNAESEGASGATYGMRVSTSANATTTKSSFAAANTGAGNAYGLYSTKTLAVSNCSLSGSSEGGNGYGLGCSSTSSVSLGAGCTFSSSTGDISISKAISLLSTFSTTAVLSVYHASSISNAIFANLADSLDADALAEQFEAAEGSYYEGYTAVASSDGSSLEWSTETVKDSSDLYDVLTDDDGEALTENVYLDCSKSYYLSKSLSGYEGYIYMTEDGTYDIDLRGNTITGGDSGFWFYPHNTAGGTTTLNLYSTDGNGTATTGYLVDGKVYGYTSTTNGYNALSMKNVDISVSKSVTTAYTAAAGVAMMSGTTTVAIEDCSIDVDYEGTENTSKHMVVGLRIDNSSFTTSVELSNMEIDVTSNSPYAAVAAYVNTRSCTVSVEDCTLAAESSQNTAVAFYNDKYLSNTNAKITFSGTTSLSATGGTGSPSIGILNFQGDSGGSAVDDTPGRAVTLNGAVEFATEATSYAAALASDVQYTESSSAPFTLGASFSSESGLSVAIGLDITIVNNGSGRPFLPTAIQEDANTDDTYIATFASGVDSSNYETMVALLSSANSLVSTEPALADDGIYFAAETFVSAAHIVRDGETLEYSTLEKATADAADCETVYLDMDLTGTEVIAESSSADEGSIAYTLDLNGYDVGCLSCETSQDVTVTDGSEDGSSTVIGCLDNATYYGVVQEGGGTLSLVGVAIDLDNVTVAYGVRVAAGELEMSGCSVSIDSYSGSEWGVYVAANASAGLEGCSIDIEGSSGSAYGVYARYGSSAVELSDCSVGVESAGSLAAAACVVEGTLSVSTSEEGSSSLSATGVSSSTVAYGVYARGQADVALDGCELSATAAGDASDPAFGVYATRSTSTASSTTYGPAVSLAGDVAFSSSTSTDVYHEQAVLVVDEDAGLSGSGGDGEVAVESVELDGDEDVFAEPAAEGGSLEGLRGAFAPAQTSTNTYLGCEVICSDDGSLSWSKDVVAELEDADGEEIGKYTSLARALAASSEGDTVTMVGDSLESALSVAHGVTVDLAGRTVSVISTSSTSAVSVSGGRLTLADSEGGGEMSVTLSMSGTLSLTAYTQPDAALADDNVGLYAYSGAGITLDGCAVSVTNASGTCTTAVTGVYAAGSSSPDEDARILLTGGAELAVEAGTAQKAYGAYAGSGYAEGVANVQVDEGARVSVENGNDFLEQSYSNPSLSSTVAGEVWLVELDVDESSDLWAEVLEAFLKYATLSTGPYMYTMSAVELSDGTLVWACSDEVDEDNVGKEAYIVPSVVYVMTDAEVSPDAVGVGDYGTSGATISVEGTVEAESANGNAYALLVSANSTWEVDGAELCATSYGTGTYLKLSQYAPEGAGNFKTSGENSYRSVTKSEPAAAAVATGEISSSRASAGYEEATVVLSGQACLEATSVGGFASDVMAGQVDIDASFEADEGSVSVSDAEGQTSWADTFAVSADGQTAITDEQAEAFADANGVFAPVLAEDALSVYWDYGSVTARATVTFTGAYGADGSKLDDVSLEVRAGAALGVTNAAQAPEASDYGSYRFVGWQAGTGGDVIDPECLFAYEVEEDTTFIATYVYVSSSQQLVVFKVDDVLYASAVSDGSAVTWRQVSGQSGTSPSCARSGTWEFSGWYEGYYGDYLELDEGMVDYGTSDTLPTASGGGDDAWYTAVFVGDSTSYSSVTLYYYSDWDGSGSWSYGSGSFTLAEGTDIASDESVTSGTYLVSGTPLDCVTQETDGTWLAHVFLGWSVRSTDVEPLSSLPAVGGGVSTYYAVYESYDMDVDVTFVGEDGESCTVTVGSGASVADAMDADGYEELTAPAGKQLAGWAYEEGAESVAFTANSLVYLYATDNFSAPANGSGDLVGSATFYAVWETADPVSLILHVNGGMWSDSNAEDFEDEVTPGIAIEWGSYSAPYRYGSYFLEWNDEEDGSGDDFDVTADAVPENGLELWAQYGDIGTDDVADGAAVDVSAALVRTSAAVGASGVYVSLASADDADENLSVNTSYYETLSEYRLSVDIVFDEGTSNETSVQLTSSFGTLSFSAPVDETYAGRDIYALVLDEDGTTQTIECDVETDDEGNVLATFSLDSYASSTVANVVLVYALTSDEINLNTAKSQAKELLNALYATYSQDDYTGDESTGTWGELCSYYEAGLSAIAAATSLDEVADAYAEAADAMASVETTAGLALAQAEALEKLAEAYASYSSDDYSSSNWAKLVAAYEAAKEAISAAETTSEATSAASAGIIAMAKITVSSSSSSSSSLSSSSNTLSSSSGSTLSSSSGSSSLSSSSGSSLSGSSGVSLTSSSSSGLSSTAANTMSMLEGEFLTVTETVASAFALQATSGVVVLTVEEGGALDAAGVQVGDVIVAVDGQSISTLDELEEYLSGKSAGDIVTLTVNRGGEEIEITVTLSDAAESDEDATSDGEEDGSDDSGGSGGSGALKWIGSHAGQLVVVLLLILFLVGLIVGLLLRRRKKDDEEQKNGNDGFWLDKG